MKPNSLKLVDKLVDMGDDLPMPRPRPDRPGARPPDTIGAFDAKTHLAELLEQVATEGASITITRRGVPVARLVPAGEPTVRAPERLLRAFRSFQDAHALPDVTTRDLIDEGRRR
jgi:prevent-host-death family protein